MCMPLSGVWAPSQEEEVMSDVGSSVEGGGRGGTVSGCDGRSGRGVILPRLVESKWAIMGSL